MNQIPDDLISARAAAKAEYAAAGNDHRAATDRLDDARKALKVTEDALDDWFAVATGRKAAVAGMVHGAAE